MPPAARDSTRARRPWLRPCRRGNRTTPETRGPRSRRTRRRRARASGRSRRIDTDAGERERRNHGGREDTLADVDDHDPERERPCLACAARWCRPRYRCRPCGCRRRRRKNRREAAEHGAEQVRQRELESELDHGRCRSLRITSQLDGACYGASHSPSHARRRSSGFGLGLVAQRQGSRYRAARLLSTRPTSSSSSPRNTLAVTRSPLSKRARRRLRLRPVTRSRSIAISTSPGFSPARCGGAAVEHARELEAVLALAEADAERQQLAVARRAACRRGRRRRLAARNSSATPNSASSSAKRRILGAAHARSRRSARGQAAELDGELLEAVLRHADCRARRSGATARARRRRATCGPPCRAAA